jgi:large subunit ribosomal protein L23
MTNEKSPYSIILKRRVTEKAAMLGRLQHAMSNLSVARCKTPKLVFDVDPRANKVEIAQAVEAIYADRKIKVLSVNTVSIKSKPRRVRGRLGRTAAGKKAIVTLAPGNSIEEG